MRTSKFLSRFKSIKMIAVTDTGDTIEIDPGMDYMLNVNIDAIYTPTVIIGHTFAHMLVKWVDENRIETPMLKALASGKYKLEYMPSVHCRSIGNDKYEYFITLRDKSYKDTDFVYEHPQDAHDDLEYAIKKYSKK